MTRFSQLYVVRGEPDEDSKRFRNRLRVCFFTMVNDSLRDEVAYQVQADTGADFPYYSDVLGREFPDFQAFFENAEIRDILDSITIVWKILEKKHFDSKADDWREAIEVLFKEQNMVYQIDQDAIVHSLLDKVFEQEHLAVLECLSDRKFSAVKAEFEKAYTELRQHSPDRKEAVRAIYESIEILSKLFDASISRLGPKEVMQSIKPRVNEVYSNDQTALDSANRILSSFSEWINSVQVYRHGQRVETRAVPPRGLAILIVSQGASYLRWFLEIYEVHEVLQ